MVARVLVLLVLLGLLWWNVARLRRADQTFGSSDPDAPDPRDPWDPPDPR